MKKILIYSPVFYPQIGGTSTINQLLAKGLSNEGYNVVIFTPSELSKEPEINCNYKIVRSSKNLEYLKWYRKSDIILYSGLALSKTWPAIFLRRTNIIIHHCCTYNWDGSKNIQSRLKKLLTYLFKNICVSNVVASKLQLTNRSTTIHNCFNDNIFHTTNYNSRKDFIYVGRMSREKGIDLLFEAFAFYQKHSVKHYNLTIVGNDSYDTRYNDKLKELGIENTVIFKGVFRENELVQELNHHHCLVAPSTCYEAFGLVTLEGLACGCIVLGSNGDGIQEALKENGIYFKKGSAEDLAMKMLCAEQIVIHDFKEHQKQVQQYLQNFSVEKMTKNYMDYFTHLHIQ